MRLSKKTTNGENSDINATCSISNGTKLEKPSKLKRKPTKMIHVNNNLPKRKQLKRNKNKLKIKRKHYWLYCSEWSILLVTLSMILFPSQMMNNLIELKELGAKTNQELKSLESQADSIITKFLKESEDMTLNEDKRSPDTEAISWQDLVFY